ncbi:copper resistance CopC/CopD family protein [Streptomyces sp. DSM 15324]|uniref:copper resistance CopC/CopD family protein n=1 Tax=Streptomyces sp. DSM 15324 TaxID=1739111 RepID=UPI000747964B|nr:copper resistance protein CopC [Streptomyces sp. DSM 15324]KUO08768.1 transporter [Streptomyces sp. DSM 15324]
MLLGSVLVLLLLGGGPASAHAALRSTDPVDGSVVKNSPRSITLTFTESVGLVDDSFRLLDPKNQRVKLGEAGHVAGRSDSVRVKLPTKLGTGTFTVAWRVVSADSHPVSGAFTFSVGKASPTLAVLPSDATEDPVTDGLYNIGRYLAYIAAALLVGTAAFVAVCRPPDTRPLRRPLLIGAWTLAGSTVFLFFLRAPYEAGTGPAGALDPSGLLRTLEGRPGLALAARLLLLAAAVALLLRQRSRPEPSKAALVLGSALAVGLALTWAGAEHASAGIQVPLAMTSSVLHLLAMAVWLGGLVALLTLLPRASVPSRVVTRFSRLAGLSVTVLVVTGVYQSWRGLGSLSALTDTTYGRVLLAKLVAVTVLLAAGAWSRATVTSQANLARGTRAKAKAQAKAQAERTAAEKAKAEETAVTVEETKTKTKKETETGTGAETETEVDTDTAMEAKVLEKAAVGGTSAHGMSVGGPVGEQPLKAAAGPDAGADGTAAPSTPAAEGAHPSRPDRPSPTGPRLTPAESAHSRALRRSVLLEVAVSVVVLVLTTILTGTLPGRAAAEAATTQQSAGLPVASVTIVPFDLGKPGLRGKVQVTLDPGTVGDNTLQAVVYGPDGGFVTVPELRISFTLPSQDIGPLDAKLVDRGGYWASSKVSLPIEGTWEMKTTIRATDVDQVSVVKDVQIVR